MFYSNTNRIKFTSISERYNVPRNIKGRLSNVHSKLITYVSGHFSNTRKYKQSVVDALNILTYCIMEGEIPPFDWNSDRPLSNVPNMDMELIENTLGELFLTIDAIEWDVEETFNIIAPQSVSATNTVSQTFLMSDNTFPTTAGASLKTPNAAITPAVNPVKSRPGDTPKEDLYIKAPLYPQFDYNKPWLSKQDGPDRLVIYTTLPEIPTKQNQISVTTDVSKMTEAELIALYPNTFIHTRASILYNKIDGLDYDDNLGVILPIGDYSRDELIDNMIQYPHFYKLMRVVDDDTIKSFYSDIEIDGELYPIEEVWDILPEASKIPKQSEYIKEYIVRRYILEENHGIKHRYRMYGTLDPFLTLFMPLEEYIAWGYKDTTSIARQCVLSRVSFKQSRNPILRRLQLGV